MGVLTNIFKCKDMKFILTITLTLCIVLNQCYAAECQDSDFKVVPNLCTEYSDAIKSCNSLSGSSKQSCIDAAVTACNVGVNTVPALYNCECPADTCNSTASIAASIIVMLLARL